MDSNYTPTRSRKVLKKYTKTHFGKENTTTKTNRFFHHQIYGKTEPNAKPMFFGINQ